MSEIGHNQPDRREIIRSIKAELDEIEIDKGLISLRAKKAKGRIKAELGWKVVDFNAMIRVVDLEEDAREELFSVMREGFKALEIGVQSNFLDAIDPAPAKPKKGKKSKAEQIAEAVQADAETPEQQEIAEQKAEDEAKFTAEEAMALGAFEALLDAVDDEEFVESEEPLDA